MESKSFWTWYLLRANSLIRSVLFCCFLKGELHSKCLIIGLCIAVLLISKLSFGSRLTSLWGKGCCATVVSYTIFLQQKSKERELETVVIMHERKSKQVRAVKRAYKRDNTEPHTDCSLMAGSCKARNGKSDKIETFTRCPFTVTKWPLGRYSC